MNLDPKNYVALLNSIIRTDPSLVATLRSVLKAYLQLDPYEDLLSPMEPKLKATLLHIIQDINEIENPFTLEQEIFFLLEHLNQIDIELEGPDSPYDDEGFPTDEGKRAAAKKKVRVKAAVKTKAKVSAAKSKVKGKSRTQAKPVAKTKVKAKVKPKSTKAAAKTRSKVKKISGKVKVKPKKVAAKSTKKSKPKAKPLSGVKAKVRAKTKSTKKSKVKSKPKR